MDDAVAQEGRHHASNRPTAIASRASCGARLEVDEFLAVEPLQRQQAPRREFVVDARHAHEGRVGEHDAHRAARPWPRARSRAPRAPARGSRARSRACRSPRRCRLCSENRRSSCERSVSTAEAISGYCSLQATAFAARASRALWTWPSEAAAAGLKSNSAKRSRQSGRVRRLMRRRTKPAPIGGACDCSRMSSSA